MFLGPVYIHSAFAHGFEGALHANGADIDVTDHGRDEQHGDDAVRDLSSLHARNVCAVERKHQHITANGDGGAAENHDPIDHLLTGIEPIGWWFIMPDESATALEPLDINTIWNIAGNPH